MPTLDPFHSDLETANKAYIACGKIATGWGPVELAIELLIVMLRNRQKAPVKGHAFIHFPISYSKKVTEVKDRLRDDSPVFDDMRPRISRLLGEATQIHKRREIICHSRLQGVMGDGDLVFTRSEQKRGYSAVWKRLTFPQLEADFQLMDALADEIAEIAHQIRLRGIGPDAPPYVPASRRGGSAPSDE